MKIKRQARTEHMCNKASATLMCRYSKRRIKSYYVYRLNYKSFYQALILSIIVIATLKVKEDLWEVLKIEPTDGELAEATNMSTSQSRKLIAHGQATRNKLIRV
ncbi:hypothetical protein Hanom_Chr14g01336021 [Helianthus anomalus]